MREKGGERVILGTKSGEGGTTIREAEEPGKT